jgi:hypothetical protein
VTVEEAGQVPEQGAAPRLGEQGQAAAREGVHLPWAGSLVQSEGSRASER